MRAIASALGLARSNLIERRQRRYFVRRRRCVDDSGLTEKIKQVVDARPTYGYLRTTRLVSRALVASGEAAVNAKRVYRIMKAQGWLLARHTGKSHTRRRNKLIGRVEPRFRIPIPIEDWPSCW
jgi:putative transposase